MMKFLLKSILAIIFLYLFFFLNNEWLTVNEVVYESEQIPSAFDDYKILQLTDLHDAEFGQNHKRLITKVEQSNPDIIVFTGDVIDSRRFNLEKSLSAMKQLVEIAPVYYVQGNHEVATNEMDTIYKSLEEIGIQTLKNEHVVLESNEESIVLAGIEDALMGVPTEEMIERALFNVSDEEFTILLSHRPEKFETYVEHSIPLILTGHAHGGQIRLPLIGGLVAPSQGWFPEYTGGLYEENGTSMLVNRGLGNSAFPLRLFNRPEIIEIILKHKS